jgi:predicted Fe-S protein YdhL (DUF1289 family)
MSTVTDWCEGCFRSIDEIRQWSHLGDPAKRGMWQVIEQRAAASIP